MFAKGATPGKVRTWCYDEEAEDFTKGELKVLFIWGCLIRFTIQMLPP